MASFCAGESLATPPRAPHGPSRALCVRGGRYAAFQHPQGRRFNHPQQMLVDVFFM
jgi:hypothetical protein